MTKFVKSVLLLFCLFITAAIAFPFVAYQWEQPHQRERQIKILNYNFAKVQLKNGKVLFVSGVPRGHSRVMRTTDGNFLEKSVLFSVGSQFEASDHHWGATYTITSIEPDGVVIHFDAHGDSPAAIRASSGNVKLAWK